MKKSGISQDGSAERLINALMIQKMHEAKR